MQLNVLGTIAMPIIVLAPIIRAPFHNIHRTCKCFFKNFTHMTLTRWWKPLLFHYLLFHFPLFDLPYGDLKKNKKQKNSMGVVEVIVNDYSKKNRNCHGLWWVCLIVIIQSMLVGGMRVKDGSKDQRPKESIGFLNMMIPLTNNLAKKLAWSSNIILNSQ
jgi:hypothetical protein